MNKHLLFAYSKLHGPQKAKSKDLDSNIVIGSGLKTNPSKWKIMDNLDFKPRTGVYGLNDSSSAITNGAGVSDYDILKRLHFKNSKPKKVKL